MTWGEVVFEKYLLKGITKFIFEGYTVTVYDPRVYIEHESFETPDLITIMQVKKYFNQLQELSQKEG